VLLAVTELPDLVPEDVARVVALAVGEPGAGRAGGVECVEGLLEAQDLGRAVAGVGIGDAELHPGREEVGVGVVERQEVAIDVPAPVELELLPRAEEVLLGDLQRRLVLAALAAEIDARVERPVVARAHDEVDRAAVPGHRLDGRVVQVVVGAQDALGLLHEPVHVRVAGPEQQLGPQVRGARADVQRVGRAIEPASFPRDGVVEHVAGLDRDVADHRVRCLEFLGRRQR